jgi:signal transduction histidine kinase
MAKISELALMLSEISRGQPSLAMQRVMRASAAMDSQSGVSLTRKLDTIKRTLEDVKREAKDLDHKTFTKLNQAISDLTNMSFDIKKMGLKAVESHED